MSGDIGEQLAKIIADQLQPILRDLHMLKSTFSRMVKEGAVEEIDAAQGYRIKLGEGEDGTPYLSGWVPHPEDGKQSTPLKKGQRVALLCPGGDIRQALIIRSGYSDEHPSPNQDMEANVFSDGGYTQTIKSGGMTISATGEIQVTASGGHFM